MSRPTSTAFAAGGADRRLERRGRRAHGLFNGAAFATAQQLLHAADGIAFIVEQPMDLARKLDIGGPVIAAVAGALQRPQLREFGFPIAQDVLRDAELLR